MANNSLEGNNGGKIRLHVDGLTLGLTQEELRYVPPAEERVVYSCDIHPFYPKEPVKHPEEVSLEAISDRMSHEGRRTYPTFGAPTRFDQDQ